MASPQKEDGFTPIAHEILEKLSCQVISPDEWRVLLVIFRKTYGWEKKEDWISLSQFVAITKMKKPHICRAISKLISRNIITRSGNVTRSGNEFGVTYGFQKNYDLWKVLPKQATLPDQVMTVTRSGKASLPKQVPTIETNTIETITKERTTIAESYPEKATAGIETCMRENGEIWGKAYPAINIAIESTKALSWLVSNPQNRKTNFKRFLNNWFSRAQEKAPRVLSSGHKTMRQIVEEEGL